MESQNKNVCKICEKEFSSPAALNVHIRTKCKNSELTQKKKTFDCVCGKTLSSKQMLKYHMETCVENQVKKTEEEHNREYALLRKQIQDNSFLSYNNINQSLFLIQTEFNRVQIELKTDFNQKMEKNEHSLEYLKTQLNNLISIKDDFEDIKRIKENALQTLKEELRKDIILELKDQLRIEILEELKKNDAVEKNDVI
jgi:hypothetical protein